MEEDLIPSGENELLKEGIDVTRSVINELYPDKESQGTQQETTPAPEPTTDHLMVDGQDLSNHPHFERLRLDIPYKDDEGKPGYYEKYPEIYGNYTKLEAARIFMERQHALSEEGNVGIELSNSIKKGGLDLVSSVLTAPERALDMVTGQMTRGESGEIIDKRTGKPYRPDWDPLGNVTDMHQNSWWGKLAQAATHYGIGRAWAARLPGVAQLNLTQKAMVAEGIVAGVSEYSQGDNVSGQIVKELPWTENVFGALATNDHDHPLLLTFKNVVEEMSFAKVFGFIAGKFGGDDGAQYALRKADDVDAQIKEKAQLELEEETAFDLEFRKTQIDRQLGGDVVDVDVLPDPKEIGGVPVRELPPGRTKQSSGFRGHKNKPYAQPGQGSPSSTGKAFDIHQQMNRMDDWGNDIGSTDSVMTPAWAQRTATTAEQGTKYLKIKAKELLGDSKYQDLIKEAKKNQLRFHEVFEPAFKRYQEIMGRHATAVDTEDFWKPIIDEMPFQTGSGASTPNYEAWAMENVVLADLVNGALFKELRNLNIAARQLRNTSDVFAKDGLMDSVKDRLTFGLANVKRSRYLISTEFSKLRGPTGTLSAKAKKAIKERTVQLHTESKEAVDRMMELLKNGKTDELAETVMDVFSMQNKIQNWMDFDKWMHQKIVGGEFDGQVKTGAWVKELQGVFINSILSGPKTPLRAIIGTTSNAYLNSMHNLLGASTRILWTGDFRSAQIASQNTFGMLEIIPDAWKVFKTSWNSNFGKNISNLETRFSSKQRLNDQKFAAYGQWAEDKGSLGEKAAFRVANMGRWLNDRRWATWSPRVLATTDETFKYIMAKARSKELAFASVYDEVAQGQFKEITPELLKAAEDTHYNRYIDEDGVLDITRDPYLQQKFKEVTLTTELQGKAKALDKLFNQFPSIKPFFLFARTGVNGLTLNVKNTPLLGALVNESRDILMANPDDLASVFKYGIQNADDLVRAKNLIIGRQAMGSAVVTMAAQKYLAGQMTGSGPANRQQRALWRDTKWERNTITLGGVRVGFDTFEPYNLVLQTICNIGDNMQLMGTDWGEDALRRVAFSIGASIPEIASKSYLAGIMQLVDIFTTDRAPGRIAGNILNNTIPMAGMRNEVGKILNPRMRELSKSLGDAVRNRNLALEHLAVGPIEELPLKYDLLTGEPLRDWNFMERMFNAVSPISLSLAESPGRTLLWNSQYDLRMSILSTPNNGPSLAKEPKVRSMFAKEIGLWRDEKGRSLQQILDHYSELPQIQASLAEMHKDQRAGDYDIEPLNYHHNTKIKALFKKARNAAWNKVTKSGDADVLRVLDDHKQRRKKNTDAGRKSNPRNTQREKVQEVLSLQNR